MIRHLLAWKMSRRPRTARFMTLCAVLGVLAGIFVATSDQVQAQTVRPLQGTLILKVPRGLLPSQDYWLYVNGQIVSAPPYEPFAHNREFSRIDVGVGYEYWDRDGRAARFEGGRFTYLRPGVREPRVFESHPIQLAPGKYVVELLTRAVNRSFPFAVARIEAQVAAGKTEEIEFGTPAGTDELMVARASRCSTCSFSAHPPDKTMEFIQNDFNRTVQEYGEIPIVAVLNQVQLNLSVTPPSQSSVFANLPDSMGGGRALDARQVSLIIEGLETNYRFPSIDGNSSLRSAAPPILQVAALISLQINEHNKRIDNFRQIVKALEQAKRQ